METQRFAAREEVESARSAVQEVGRDRICGRTSKIRKVNDNSDVVMTSELFFVTFLELRNEIQYYHLQG